MLLKKTKEKVLLTMIERVSRHSIIRLIESKTAACVSKAIRALQKEYGTSFDTIFQSITLDNGSEFADLTSCLEHTATEVYYAHPFSSWERGANEQNNGMIRRFIPNRRKVIDENKQRFIKGLSLVEDIVFNGPILSECNKISFVEETLVHYMQRPRETLGSKFYGNYYDLKQKANILLFLYSGRQ